MKQMGAPDTSASSRYLIIYVEVVSRCLGWLACDICTFGAVTEAPAKPFIRCMDLKCVPTLAGQTRGSSRGSSGSESDDHQREARWRCTGCDGERSVQRGNTQRHTVS